MGLAMRSSVQLSLYVVALLCFGGSVACGDEAVYQVGAAKVDVTPGYPIRLNGFGGRRTESEGITQRIWAKALAIGSDEEKPIVLISLDSLGIRESMVDEVAKRLKEKAGIQRDRIAVTFSHSHTTPKVNNACDTIFSSPIPPQHQANIDRYTIELTNAMEEAALKALADRKPSTLSWAVGRVTFAVNRRPQGGPVDHDLPVLVVKSVGDGAVRAVYVTYACHCVTLSDNRISGDWSGFAQEAIERTRPGAIALVSIGCGSDANPSSGVTGANTAVAADQGSQVSDEVDRLLAGTLKPVSGKIVSALSHIDIPLNPVPTKAELEKIAAAGGSAGYNATFQIEKLKRGETLQSKLDYPIQTWAFGDSLAMVFLAGEVCSDYSIRLKGELDPARVWLHGYSNDFCAYIPSERLLKEGGYGGGAETVYFALPNTIAAGIEEKIIKQVHAQIPRQFEGKGPRKQASAQPWPLEEALASIVPKDGFVVEVAAAEPLVADPVAIDFGPDGRMWVAEMPDYTRFAEEEFKQNGNIRVLTDDDGDGRYDRADKFVDGLRFPTDVKWWRNGVIVCDAPDVIYFEDANSDGKADSRKVLLTGFETHNAQARVNSLRWGLDNWLYGSCGLFGGKIRTHSGREVELGARDFRFRPDTGELEPVTGNTQQGRTRDSWGNWFGCNNGSLIVHYPLNDAYLSRNPHIAPPSDRVSVPAGPDPNALYPISEPSIFALSGPPGRPTAACGLEIYRDELLGAEFAENSFVAEPVNQLVHRRILSSNGSTFSGKRAADEADREFLASTDPWFRPVQLRTGIDGCLYVVDMHRAVIEHPKFIPKEVLEKLHVTGGREQGRIFRVRPANVSPRPIARLDRLNENQLAAAIDSPNGPQRDSAQQILVERREVKAASELKQIVRNSPRPASRLQALCTLDGLAALDKETLLTALADADPPVRRHAVRLSEPLLANSPDVAAAVLKLAGDDDPQVVLQLAYTLGESPADPATDALVSIAVRHHADPYLLTAVWSSVDGENVGRFVARLFASVQGGELPVSLSDPAIRLVNALGSDADLKAVALALADRGQKEGGWLFDAAAKLLEQSRRRAAVGKEVRTAFAPMIDAARQRVKSTESELQQLPALRLLAASGAQPDELIDLLTPLLAPRTSPAIQEEAIRMASSLGTDAAAEAILSAWRGFTPAVRAQAFDVILGKPQFTSLLVDRIEAAEIAATDLDALQRQRLAGHSDANIRSRALVALASAVDANRDKIVRDYIAASQQSKGDLARGRQAFVKHCSSCHRLEEQGQEVGPDLAAVTSRTPAALIESILDPNRAVDQRYRSYSALTTDGLSLNGILTGETSTSITLTEQQGKKHSLLRAEIEILENTGKSLMPEGLEKDISPADITDLVAYIASIGPAAKTIAGNEPKTVAEDYDGAFWLLAENCQIFGDQITFEAPFRNIGYWHGQNDFVSWNLDVPKARDFEVYLHWACAPESAGNAFVVAGGITPLTGVAASTGGYDRYATRRIGRLSLPAGKNRIVVRPDGPLSKVNLLDLRGVYLVPVGVSADRAIAGEPPASGADAATAIAELLDGLAVGKPEEYERIPSIWQHAIAAGKRNSASELRRIMDLALPHAGQPLEDWQAVVIGGGVVNGLSQVGEWPDQRLAEIMKGVPSLLGKWNRTLKLADKMAGDEETPTGTRYDALRILGAGTWSDCGPRLAAFLSEGAHAELQMGAVSGLNDFNSEEVAPLLVKSLSYLKGRNKQLAVDALLRTPGRAQALLSARSNAAVSPELLTEKQWKSAESVAAQNRK
jgi:putative membrane-bound dehydrogenase-like protein